MKREIQLHTKSGKKLINKSNKLPQYNYPIDIRIMKKKEELGLIKHKPKGFNTNNTISKEDRFDLIWLRITSEVKQKEYKHV